MKKLPRFLVVGFIFIDVILFWKILLAGKNVQVLNPAGLIAYQERGLIFLAVGLMLLGVIPVFIFAFYVATKYHVGNEKAKYMPEWDHDNKLQLFYWGGLLFILTTLSVIVWVSAHAMDPRVALKSNVKPLVIQVVALRWKWLFIYPNQGIASINEVVFPEKTPVDFHITASDSPMNSFWIPQLGGQIYAMSGMATETHLMADGVGHYRGSTAEISGAGFANMTFAAKSVTQNDFDTWVAKVKQTPNQLTYTTVRQLSQPSENVPITYYSSTASDLFNTIVMQYMAKPSNENQENTVSSESMPNMPEMHSHVYTGS